MNKTPLNSLHRELGAKMVDFAGWEMPIQYSGIIKEHMNVRTKAGLFDVSHMGDLFLEGKGAGESIDRISTRKAVNTKMGQFKYTHILDEQGHIMDDVIFGRLSEDRWIMVPNAGTAPMIYDWVKKHADNCTVENRSSEFACLALQGPESLNILKKITDYDIDSMKMFWGAYMKIDGLRSEALVSRTGYTGELGVEIIVPAEEVRELWDTVMKAGDEYGICPVGLGARDTLRLEKGFLLSGQDFFGEQTTLNTGLEWVISWKHDFIGKDVLLRQKESGDYERLVGVIAEGRGIPRHGFEIWKDGKKVGILTSGTISPVLKKGIGLGYVPPELTKVGTELAIIGHGKEMEATVSELPFVK